MLTCISRRVQEIHSAIAISRGIVDVFYNGGRLTYFDQSYDSIVCNQVLEHVFEPNEFLGDINRVLKPGGRLLVSVPFVWDEHEQPNDFPRYTSFRLTALLKTSGFSVLQHQKLGADATVLFQLTNADIYKVIQLWPKVSRVFIFVTIIATFNVIGFVLSKILPKNPDIFLDQVVLAEKLP